MKRVVLMGALVALTGCANGFQIPDFRGGGGAAPAPTPAVAVAPPPAPVVLTAKERLVAAIENNNCELTAANVGAILNEATIGTEELKTLTSQLEAEGRVEVAGTGTIRVNSSRCI